MLIVPLEICINMLMDSLVFISVVMEEGWGGVRTATLVRLGSRWNRGMWFLIDHLGLFGDAMEEMDYDIDVEIRFGMINAFIVA